MRHTITATFPRYQVARGSKVWLLRVLGVYVIAVWLEGASSSSALGLSCPTLFITFANSSARPSFTAKNRPISDPFDYYLLVHSAIPMTAGARHHPLSPLPDLGAAPAPAPAPAFSLPPRRACAISASPRRHPPTPFFPLSPLCLDFLPLVSSLVCPPD